MDQKIQQALEAGLNAYASVKEIEINEFGGRLAAVFDADVSYLEKVDQLDAVFDENLPFDELREVVFDLLLMNFFAADVEKLERDYLESEEWETIEDQTIDRGTELLNLLLYLRECADDGIEPQLEDYLKEFLLVDEDEFQDEYRIYEYVIANQALADSSYEEIAKVASELPKTQELEELFYPMMSFFFEPSPSDTQMEAYEKCSLHPGFDAAVYSSIIHYNR